MSLGTHDNNKVPRIDRNVTINIFKKFAGVNEIDEEIADCIMLCTDAFWEFVVKSWESYARHAGRQHIVKSDVQLHMLRIGLIQDYNSFSALVTSHLPLELRTEILQLARARQPYPRQKLKNMNTSVISAGQAYARRKLFSPVLKRARYFSKK